jgi:hypothetical protein
MSPDLRQVALHRVPAPDLAGILVGHVGVETARSESTGSAKDRLPPTMRGAGRKL